ncbi:MAG: hypothetical protein KAS94_13210 [Desulfobulbaceae bacterium]|nr:hypothetical protein [Desulfobulbaceae bacterium]
MTSPENNAQVLQDYLEALPSMMVAKFVGFVIPHSFVDNYFGLRDV